MLAVASHSVEGHVSRGFEAVREAFAENFARRGELGGACCAYHHGENVVDLWGGIRNKQTAEPWERDTMVLVYSATKGLLIVWVYDRTGNLFVAMFMHGSLTASARILISPGTAGLPLLTFDLVWVAALCVAIAAALLAAAPRPSSRVTS
jgi:hypothetical protein